MPYPWTISIIIAFMFYGAIVIMFTEVGKEILRDSLEYVPNFFLLMPLGLFAIYLWYTHHAGGIDPKIAAGVLAYWTIPCFLIWLGRDKPYDTVTIYDPFAIVALWVPFDLHLIGKRPHAIHDALDWPMIAVSSVLIALVGWKGLRRMEGTKTRFSFQVCGFALALGGLICLAAALIPLGMHFNFVKPEKFWTNELQAMSVPAIIWKHLATKKFLIYFAKIYVTIALSEEMLFRGIIQNFLEKVFQSKWAPIAFASLLFGSAHLNNGAKSIDFADWNWTYAAFATVAGLAYGTVFRYANSILFAMILHGLVDSIWHTLFR